MGNDIAGVGNATSGSIADTLTRSHRMTLDEAHSILNVKRGDEMETILKVLLLYSFELSELFY
jgi:import inner membrane translocase subunit TIM16